MGSSGFMRNLKSKPFPKQTSSFWSEMIRAWITHLLACDKPLQFLMWSIWLILSVASTSSIQSYISRKPSNFLSIALCVVAQPHGLERIRQQLLNSMLCLGQHAQYTQTIPSQYAVDHEFTACTSGWFWQIHLPTLKAFMSSCQISHCSLFRFRLDVLTVFCLKHTINSTDQHAVCKAWRSSWRRFKVWMR